jgi:hypothetical protein
MARGKLYHIFPTRHNLFLTVSAYFNWGGKYKIFNIFPPTFTDGVLGENILSLCVNVFPLCLCFPPGHAVWYISFTFLPRQLLGYELEEKQYNIFPPCQVLFLLVTEKLFKKLMGKEKWYFFPYPYFSPLDYAVFGSPSQTFTVLRCMK